MEIERISKKKAIQQTEYQVHFSSNIFLVEKAIVEKGNQPVANVVPEPVYSISAFQNGRFVLPPRNTTEGRLYLQAGHEKSFFSIPLHHSTESLRVPLFTPQLGTNSQESLQKY